VRVVARLCYGYSDAGILGVGNLPNNVIDEAWNNFVLSFKPTSFPPGDARRSAAIARRYMNGVLSGGINSFLTDSYEISTTDVRQALEQIGAYVAAKDLGQVIEKIGGDLPISDQEGRWRRVEEVWTDDCDEFDCLTDAAEADIVSALEKHVEENLQFYLGIASTSLN